MILADSSVWIRHLRVGLPEFELALRQKAICTHWVVIGELAAGNLPKRTRFLADLRAIRRAQHATAEECLAFIEAHNFYGRGIGWGDLQLLAAARLSGCPLWSLDKRLAVAAVDLGVAHTAP
jgi:predicted nucleic acid-binding protein